MMTPSSFGRRTFIQKSLLSTFGALLGAEIVFGAHLPEGWIPIALLDGSLPVGKHPDLIVLGDKPLNIETPAHLLADRITPADKMFVRNNGKVPEKPDPNAWKLEISGESVKAPKTYSLAELKKRFATHSYQLTLECAGNGRSEYNPPANGNQWGVGAVSCAVWTGARLADVLQDVGMKGDAVYVAYYGADPHLSGDPKKSPISRGVPIQKAMEAESLLAWQMNGADIPLLHGFPLRMVIGGWPASCSGKWLTKLTIRNKVHDGEKMNGTDYRLPCDPIAPGAKADEKNMCIIEAMPVKSVITTPKSGAVLKGRDTLTLKGHAWVGDSAVKEMHLSIDFGATWVKCQLNPPANRLAWQQWEGTVRFPQKGYYEVWAKATDSQGVSQPMVVPGWNPKGYNNNACHRIAVKVEG